MQTFVYMYIFLIFISQPINLGGSLHACALLQGPGPAPAGHRPAEVAAAAAAAAAQRPWAF